MSNENTDSTKTLVFSDGYDAAAKAGRLMWNYLERLDVDSEKTKSTLGSSIFSGIGVVGSLVTCGVNLAMGGRNLKKKQSTHALDVTLNNFTPYTIVVQDLDNVDNACVKQGFFLPGDSGQISLGTRNYAGESQKDLGPIISMRICTGNRTFETHVKYIDSSGSGYSGQIRIRSVGVDGLGREDRSGEKSSENMKHPFYIYDSEDIHFMISSTPVSNGSNADVNLNFIA